MKWMINGAVVFLAAGLMACSQQEEAPAPEPTAVIESAPQPAPEPVKASGPGGYEPTADERVPGITMSQEEIDKQTAAALANTPLPDIPGEPSAEK